MVKMSQAVSLCVTDGFFIERDKGKPRYLCVSRVLKLVEAVGIEAERITRCRFINSQTYDRGQHKINLFELFLIIYLSQGGDTTHY